LTVTRLSPQFQNRYNINFGGRVTFVEASPLGIAGIDDAEDYLKLPDGRLIPFEELPEGMEVCVASLGDIVPLEVGGNDAGSKTSPSHPARAEFGGTELDYSYLDSITAEPALSLAETREADRRRRGLLNLFDI
jgi:hypothetical protein